MQPYPTPKQDGLTIVLRVSVVVFRHAWRFSHLVVCHLNLITSVLTKKTTTVGTAALLCRSKYGRYHGQNIIEIMGKIAIFPKLREWSPKMLKISLEELCRYTAATPATRNMREGQEIINSGLLIMCGVTERTAANIQLYALYLQTSGITSDPHVVTGNLTIESSVYLKTMTFSSRRWIASAKPAQATVAHLILRNSFLLSFWSLSLPVKKVINLLCVTQWHFRSQTQYSHFVFFSVHWTEFSHNLNSDSAGRLFFFKFEIWHRVL